MSILVRAEETGFIELPVRLVTSAGVPVDGVLAAHLEGGGCVEFFFANGDEETIHLSDAVGSPPYTKPTWRQVEAAIPLSGDPVGLYHITVPRRIFTQARRGPFQYTVVKAASFI